VVFGIDPCPSVVSLSVVGTVKVPSPTVAKCGKSSSIVVPYIFGIRIIENSAIFTRDSWELVSIPTKSLHFSPYRSKFLCFSPCLPLLLLRANGLLNGQSYMSPVQWFICWKDATFQLSYLKIRW